MVATLSPRPQRLSLGSAFPTPLVRRLHSSLIGIFIITKPWRVSLVSSRHSSTRMAPPVKSGLRADDSAPCEMSVENALKLLGVSEGASFDDILRAKNSILANCKNDQESIAQVFLSALHHLIELYLLFYTIFGEFLGKFDSFHLLQS
ncbi:hypothetical protein QN277_025875 [Acacia crassicarpa]|uniref:Uncharacterized protein n=1 Tax=Acacia crassicarpa TaxID=499986 RepID=A0AAE1MET1_9FABA|nr:hypothetical protein QN277_025875 [Acacia crassicarpa]